MKLEKQHVILYGNCQSGFLSDHLRRNPEISERFEIIHIPSNYETRQAVLLQRPDLLATCSHIIWQTAAGCRPPEFVSALPASCRQIRYPTLCLKLLWPLHALDPRSQPETGFPAGRFPYGDRLLMKLLGEGVPVSDLYQRYLETDLNTIVNLDRFSEMALAELRCNDRQSDISIAPVIESAFRHRRLFVTINHPTFLLLNHLSHALAAALLDQPLPAQLGHQADDDEILMDQEIPLHPQVVRHLRLSWVTPARKWQYGTAVLTLEEYVRAYGEYQAIPFGGHEPSWLERAHRAMRENNIVRTRSILFQAIRAFPQTPVFSYTLGKFLAGKGQLAEAERVLCSGIAQHPNVTLLKCELAGVWQRLGLPDHASTLLREVLRLEPGNTDARRQLESILAVPMEKL